MNNVLQSKFACSLAVMLLSGCGTLKQQVSAYEQGWRFAKIVSTSEAQKPYKPTHGDCRQAAIGKADPAQKYVLVSYSFTTNPNLRNTRVIAIPPDQLVSIDQKLRVNIKNCDLVPIVHTTSEMSS